MSPPSTGPASAAPLSSTAAQTSPLRFTGPAAHPNAFQRRVAYFRRGDIGEAGASLRGQVYKKGSKVSQVFSRNLGVTPSVGGKPTRLCKTPGSILGLVLQKVVLTNLESVKVSTVDIVDVDRRFRAPGPGPAASCGHSSPAPAKRGPGCQLAGFEHLCLFKGIGRQEVGRKRKAAQVAGQVGARKARQASLKGCRQGR